MLPCDEAELTIICRATDKQWLKHRQAMANLFVLGDGMWTHNQIRIDLAKVEVLHERRKAAGKKGNDQRWGIARTNAQKATDDLMAKITKDGGAY